MLTGKKIFINGVIAMILTVVGLVVLAKTPCFGCGAEGGMAYPIFFVFSLGIVSIFNLLFYIIYKFTKSSSYEAFIRKFYLFLNYGIYLAIIALTIYGSYSTYQHYVSGWKLFQEKEKSFCLKLNEEKLKDNYARCLCYLHEGYCNTKNN